MDANTTLLTVLEDAAQRDFQKMNMDRSNYDPKISQLLPPSISSSDDSEMDSDSDNENDNLDLIVEADHGDPNETLEAVEIKTPEKKVESNDKEFRGRPSSCVFVASLASTKTDDELSISVTKHFEQWGELALVKVLRDPSNRPYAFVQYNSDEDAKKALKGAQHSMLDGRAIRCEPAKVNRTLYIATATGIDLPMKNVKEVLEVYGEIEQMVGNNDSQFRKSNLNKAWFCKFAYRDDAIRAYANLRLSPDWIVEWAQNIESPSEAAAKDEAEVVIDKFSVFVGQLDALVTKEKLHERFSRHGQIVDIVLVIRTGNNFAFIKFETEKAAAAAVERENHAVFMDKTMHVQYRELHHKKSHFNNNQPRLNLAPPPVNLPIRRASTGSSVPSFPKQFDPRVQQMGKFGIVPNHPGFQATNNTKRIHPASYVPLNRSVSFTNDTSNLKYRYSQILGYPPSASYENEKSNTIHKTPSKTGASNSFSTPNDKHTPASSPSNHTVNSSQGDSKSIYSSTNVSVGDHLMTDDATDPTTSGYGTTKSMNSHRRSFNQLYPQQNQPIPYYYYPIPKENYLYDQPSSYLSYASYPYYYQDPPLPDYPAAPPLNSAGHHLPPSPYYMYYGVPQAPNFLESKLPQNAGQFDAVPNEADELVPEMDY